jgi:hypothetical protein
MCNYGKLHRRCKATTAALWELGGGERTWEAAAHVGSGGARILAAVEHLRSGSAPGRQRRTCAAAEHLRSGDAPGRQRLTCARTCATAAHVGSGSGAPGQRRRSYLGGGRALGQRRRTWAAAVHLGGGCEPGRQRSLVPPWDLSALVLAADES